MPSQRSIGCSGTTNQGDAKIGRWEILEILKHNYPSELGVVEISKILGTHPRNVTSKMTSLVNDGFIRISGFGINYISKYNKYKYVKNKRKRKKR